jgi:hypothetical protein
MTGSVSFARRIIFRSGAQVGSAFSRPACAATRYHYIYSWDFRKKYDFVSAWDCTWHLPLNLQKAVLQRICDGLADNGVFIFTTGGLDAPGEKSDSFTDVELSYSALGIPKTLELLARFGCACRHLEYDQHPHQHVYIVAQKAA